MMVGNGGFSLRSKRLLQTVAQPWFQLLPGAAEDDLICRNYRPILEQQHQIRFAPPQLAERFAYERGIPAAPTFGFHGMFNFWREVSDTDLIQMIPLMHPSMLHHVHTAQLCAWYYAAQRWVPLRVLYQAWRSLNTLGDVHEVFLRAISAEAIPELVRACESLLKTI